MVEAPLSPLSVKAYQKSFKPVKAMLSPSSKSSISEDATAAEEVIDAEEAIDVEEATDAEEDPAEEVPEEEPEVQG